MNTFYSELILLNKDEWILHAKKTLEFKDSKSSEELLNDVLTFNFKLGLFHSNAHFL